MKLSIAFAVLCVCASFKYHPVPPYFIQDGKLTEKNKLEIVAYFDSLFSNLSEEQQVDYKLNFILIVVRKEQKSGSSWDAKIKKVTNYLAETYQVNPEKEIEVKQTEKYIENISEGIHIGGILVGR